MEEIEKICNDILLRLRERPDEKLTKREMGFNYEPSKFSIACRKLVDENSLILYRDDCSDSRYKISPTALKKLNASDNFSNNGMSQSTQNIKAKKIVIVNGNNVGKINQDSQEVFQSNPIVNDMSKNNFENSPKNSLLEKGAWIIAIATGLILIYEFWIKQRL